MNTSTAFPPMKGDLTMCFSDPGRVVSIDGSEARVETSDGIHDVSLRLVEASGEHVAIGDWVLVSLGLVVSVIEEAQAKVLFNEMATLRRAAAR